MSSRVAYGVTILAVVLSGWKDIADYLRCSIRTAQRWEDSGLPISRPLPGRRSHVVAAAAELDLWLRDGAAWRRRNRDLLARLEYSRKIRADVQKARQTLRETLNVLRTEVAAQRAATEQIRRHNDSSQKRTSARSGAA